MLLKYLTAALLLVALHAPAASLNLNSGQALVIDRDTGETLYAKNSDESSPIASVTKLMMAMVALDEKPDMSEVLVVTRADVDTLKHSRSRLAVGSKLPRKDMFQLALMSSENRAAHALARTSKGGTKEFVLAMNLKAQKLGMNSALFQDPTGLSPGNRASPEDLAKLVDAAQRYPLIRKFTTTTSDNVKVGGHVLRYRNSNPVVGRKGWDVWLSKTGFINEAGRCVVVGMKTAGRNIAVVLLGAGSSSQREQDLLKIRNFYKNEVPRVTAGSPSDQGRHVAKVRPSSDDWKQTTLNVIAVLDPDSGLRPKRAP
jgi:D-alanyl-D-alanine endopeptidase (penicillin-binding protein 7)